MVTPVARREAIAILMDVHEMSERRACKITGADRSSARYLPAPGDGQFSGSRRSLGGWLILVVRPSRMAGHTRGEFVPNIRANRNP